ncbi:MAG: hypothetical protein AAF725_19380, partial [Acidobacteriota bacterium]
MIQILRGRCNQLLTHTATLASQHPQSFWFYCPPDHFRTWNGVRVLLHQVRDNLGSEAVDRVLSEHRAVASFAYRSLLAELSDAELARRRSIACRVESHLSHNWYLQRGLFDAWADLLIDLLPEDCRLLIPVMNHLDQPSLFVLKSLYRRWTDRAPDLVAGYSSEAKSPTLDEDGIYWTYEPLNIQKIAYGFQLSSGSDLIELDSSADSDLAEPSSDGVTPESVLPAAALAALGDDLESRARARLDSEDALEGADVDLVVAAVESTFESFGYRAALGLGLQLLRRLPKRPDGGAGLTEAQAASVHGIVALAAHNRQFQSRNNTPLENFLERHFLAAAESERQPVRRCALLYRLAVTYGRRKKQFEQALEYASAAIEAAEQLEPVVGTYQEAWARNIRAYTLMRLKRLDEAVHDAERSFSLIERYSPETREPETPEERFWARDFLLSQGVLISNLASLAAATRSSEKYDSWNRRGASLAIDDPDFDRFRVLDWIGLYRRNAQLKLALPWARKGAEVCRREQETLWEYHFLLQASDLTYRLGDAAGAFRMCEDIHALRAKLGNPIGLREVELLSVSAAVRSGRHALAQSILEEQLPGLEYPDLRSQVASHLGVLAAAAGDGERADRHLDQAIDWAVSTGQRDSLLRVAAA